MQMRHPRGYTAGLRAAFFWVRFLIDPSIECVKSVHVFVLQIIVKFAVRPDIFLKPDRYK